jgi:HK97 family phage prohead protease
MENKIRRNIELPVEVVTREIGEGEGMEKREVIKGYFSVFNSDFKMWDGYIERIMPGAFNEADMSDVVCLYNHDDDMLLGRYVNGEGTLSIGFDEKGGYFEVEKPNTSTGNDVYENIRLKNIRGCSFAFTVAEQSVEYDVLQSDGTTATIISINKVKRLYDVGPVLNPAYVETEVEASMRSSIENGRPKILTLEDQLLHIKANLI